MINENIKKYFNKKTAIILIAAGIVIILMSELLPKSTPEKKGGSEEVTAAEYVDMLEKKVKTIVEAIDGAGKCEVMITATDGGEKTYAAENKDTNNANSEKTGTAEKTEKQSESEKSYVVVDGGNGDSLVLIRETLPNITGVLVVCEGGTSTVIQNNITKAVSVLLGIPAKNICVYKKAS